MAFRNDLMPPNAWSSGTAGAEVLQGGTHSLTISNVFLLNTRLPLPSQLFRNFYAIRPTFNSHPISVVMTVIGWGTIHGQNFEKGKQLFQKSHRNHLMRVVLADSVWGCAGFFWENCECMRVSQLEGARGTVATLPDVWLAAAELLAGAVEACTILEGMLIKH